MYIYIYIYIYTCAFTRYEEPPITFALHNEGRDGRTTEYLVRCVAMSAADVTNGILTPTLNADIIHAEAHTSLEPLRIARHQKHRAAHGHRAPRYFDNHYPRGPPRPILARAPRSCGIVCNGRLYFPPIAGEEYFCPC